MPHVIVKLWPGKSEAQKKQLAERITEAVTSVLGYGDEAVSVAMQEVAAQEWATQVYQPDIVECPGKLYKKPATRCEPGANYQHDSEVTSMRATIMYRAGDVRVENVADAALEQSTDALMRITRLHLWQRPLAVQGFTAYRNWPAHGPRGDRRGGGSSARMFAT